VGGILASMGAGEGLPEGNDRQAQAPRREAGLVGPVAAAKEQSRVHGVKRVAG
jgi:hypothetical protein